MPQDTPPPRLDDAAAVRERLGLDETYAAWTESLRSFAGERVTLPEGPALTALLSALGIHGREHAGLAAALPELTAPGSAYAWLLDRAVAALAAGTGSPVPVDPGPALPARLGAPGRWFHVAVFLGCVPHVRAYHERLGVPDDVSWASLADLGNKVDVHRRMHGAGGMDKRTWMLLPFQGVLYRLGRLQFNLTLHRDGTAGVSVHIPEGGPMTPAECEESYARAAVFFPRHFGGFLGEAGLRDGLRMSCESWLLDPQLAEYLPAGGNILRFQSRYALVPDAPAAVGDETAGPGQGQGLTRGDRTVVEFVFRRVVTGAGEVAALPARTTLERAVVAHLAAGRHWRTRLGMLTVPVAG